MLLRLELSLPIAALLAATAVLCATVAPAQSQPGWTATNPTGLPYNLPTRPDLPRDEVSQYGPFASYMYGSVLPGSRPPALVRVVGDVDVAGVVVTEHVAWCVTHFGSYSVATDSYVGLDGVRHRCIAPY